MGLAWTFGFGVLGFLLLVGRRSVVIRRYEGPAAAAVFVALALASAPDDLTTARFTLEGFTFPHASGPDDPAVYLGTTPPERGPSLLIPGFPDPDQPVELRSRPPVVRSDVGGAPDEEAPPSIELDVATGSPVMIGFKGGDSPYPYSNVVPLRGGESLVVCPGGPADSSCRERTFEVLALPRGRFQVGPCDLTGEAGKAGDDERIVALLDLVHYQDDRCVPEPVDRQTPFWARREADGGPHLPLRSFLIVRGQSLYLARLDPPEVLAVDGASTPVANLSVEGSGPHELALFVPEYDVEFDELYIEELDPASPYCEEGYTESKADLSGGLLCKRVRIYYERETLSLTAGEMLHVVLDDPPSISVGSGLPEETRDEDGAVLQAQFLSGGSLGRNDPGDRSLRFPYRIERGEPVVANLRLLEEECLTRDAPCVSIEGQEGAREVEEGRVFALGGPQGEQRLLRATLFGQPWWIFAALVGLFLLQAAILPPPGGSRIERAIVGVVLVLICARCLYGFKAWVGYPHEVEGLFSGLLAAATLPVGLALAGRRETDPTRKLNTRKTEALAYWRYLATLILGLAGLGWWAAKGLFPVGKQEAMLCAALLLFFPICCLFRHLETILPFFDKHRAVFIPLTLIGLALTVLGRAALAVGGKERFADFQVILVYWPLVVVATALLVRSKFGSASESDRPGRKGLRGLITSVVRALWLPLFVAIIASAQAFLHGDAGAALALFPALAIGWFAITPRYLSTGRAKVGMAVLVAAVGLGLLGYGAHYRWKATHGYPPVDPHLPWEDAEGLRTSERGQICPGDRAGSDAPFSLDDHPMAVSLRNTEVRRDDYLRPGAANRAGPRVGSQVHESLAIMRRYAAGPGDTWLGGGYRTVDVRRYGIAEVRAQLFDGVPAVLVASEGGTVGLLGLFGLFGLVFVALVRGLAPGRGGDDAARFGALAAGFLPVWTAWMMIGGNLGVLPFTGQSTPLLAVLSGTDMVLAPILFAISLGFARLAAPSPTSGEAIDEE